MAQINVVDLTFCYEGSFDNVFENVSFSIDTNWKLDHDVSFAEKIATKIVEL